MANLRYWVDLDDPQPPGGRLSHITAAKPGLHNLPNQLVGNPVSRPCDDFIVILTLLVGGPSVQPVVVSLTSRNAESVRTRTVDSALYNISVQVGAIASANVSLYACFSLAIWECPNRGLSCTDYFEQVYQAKDEPYYKNGNKTLIALAIAGGFIFVAAKFYYDWLNKYVPIFLLMLEHPC